MIPDIETSLQSSKGLSLAVDAPLGTNTKSPSRKSRNLRLIRRQIDERILHRYYLQSLARELLALKEVPHDYDGSYKLKDHRVCMCGRYLAFDKDTVEVVYHVDKQRASFMNLSRCNSVWVCPVCAAVITEKRRTELNTAFDNWRGRVLLVTFTIRHKNADNLDDVLATLYAAYDRFMSGRYGQEKREFYEIAGAIKATEVTHGRNGFHPHLHVLYFTKWIPLEQVKALEDSFKRRWSYVVAAAGGSVTLANGLTVKDDEHFVREYIAKYGHEPVKETWSLQSEVSKANIKTGRLDDHLTPFELLAKYGEGDYRSGELFKHFAKVFHGKRQLIWSRGLKALLGVDEVTDEQIVKDEGKDANYILASLSGQQWRILRDNELIPAFHVVANTGDVDKVVQFLRSHGVILGAKNVG